MRAAYYEANGTAAEVLRLGDIERPEPGAGEVRVRLAASGVNPSDVKTRAGSRKMAYSRVVPHSDGAGTIDAVGAGVDRARVGERVWLWNGQWRRQFGTAAEFIALPAEMAVPLPDGTSFEAGACLGIPALTAWHAVMIDGPVAGQTILVSGGAGAVSHYAIQIAKASGATVLTTVSGPDKAAHATAAGADHAINYRSEDVGARVQALTGGRGVDRVIELDVTANARLLPAVLAPRGTVVVYGVGGPEAALPAPFCLFSAATIKFFLVYELTQAERAAAVSGLGGMLAAGRLSHAIGLTLPLDRIVEAHEAVEQGRVIGNVVLTL
ncbi:NADPH2:quinone reductase [Stella humosa]|uniref:NADPH2:quinone reductase n=1 Tax=Stella humosa TaxID=94 RepID=A0A3N1L1V6_9PROT|nr:NADPH:quinone reductase [Stella humosa]ROP83495.1 NADPH2:quinone reductase [Stella humosa]BBK33232.1 NADPH:quinone oxidoreductase [Stella humosa]